ncbi:MAG TPA: 50S ribosomal protein L23 [Clostridiales bacterium UBA8153]|nr:50S ribosomal protein L23 [Clostridiales bacterium UBA8153]
MEARDIIIRPLVTEKGHAGQAEGRYTFVVDARANKVQIKAAVEEIFKVEVVSVNTMRVLGKIRRVGRYQGRKPSWKKAVVGLKAGQTIELFQV